MIDLAALFGSEACCGPAALSQDEGRRGAALKSPARGLARERQNGTGSDPRHGGPDTPRAAAPRSGPALRRSKDIAAPSRLKRSRAARLCSERRSRTGEARPKPDGVSRHAAPREGESSDPHRAKVTVSAASARTGLRRPRPPPRFSPGPCGPMSHVSAAVPRQAPPGAPRSGTGWRRTRTNKEYCQGKIFDADLTPAALKPSDACGLRGAFRPGTLPL